MDEIKQISQRDAFWNKVYEFAKNDPNIVIVSADMGAPALDKIRRYIPQQFINVGIAEQNAITLAAGLYKTGKKVFVYAIAPFITLRCLEQIRVECAIMKMPITIVGVGAGFGYDDSGPTHHLIEDIAIMRAMPNIEINSVSDSIIAEHLAEYSINSKIANYVRLDRQITPDIYEKDMDIETVLKEGSSEVVKNLGEKNTCIVSTGYMTHIAEKIISDLDENIGLIDVLNFPINNDIVHLIEKYDKIITLEEHFLNGGLGSNICELLCDNKLVDRNKIIPIKRIGLKDTYEPCYKYGGRKIIHKHFGFDIDSIKKQILEFVNE